MVVFLPLLEGERTKTCSRCGMTGIGSPIRERSTFYVRRSERWGDGYRPECRRCTNERTVAYQRRRLDADPAPFRSQRRRYQRAWQDRHRELKRQRDREFRARQREEDPEAFRERERERQRRYQEKLRTDPERLARQRERDRMNHRLRKERREEGELKIAEPNKQAMAGIPLQIGPYRGWLEGRIAEEERAGEEDAFSRVAATIGVSARTLYRYLHDLDEVDEAIVDRAVSRDGRLTLYDLYPEQLEYEPSQMRATEAVG